MFRDLASTQAADAPGQPVLDQIIAAVLANAEPGRRSLARLMVE